MRSIVSVLCLLVALVASSQYSEPGFYRVHNAYSDAYISIKGTKYEKTTRPDAFWSCIMMEKDSAQISDPGSIIYIPGMEQTSLCAQGVSTRSLTHLYLDVLVSEVTEDDKPTYVATTQYEQLICYFRDFGVGMTAGFNKMVRQAHWWIEPVNEESLETSFLGVKPATPEIKDAKGWYWTSISCDYPFVIPEQGGVEGAYTIQEIEQDSVGNYFATAIKVYGRGDTVPAATPILLKCKAWYASGNKVIPVEGIANCNKMPLYNDLLMGNYFSNFTNYASYTDPSIMTEYIPDQATKASANYLALGVDEEGKLGFFPQSEDTYMAANTAWVNVTDLNLDGVDAIYLVEKEEVVEPQEPEEPVIEKGDINGDGELNISDALLFIDYLLNTVEHESDSKNSETEYNINAVAADINEDGFVNFSDLAVLLTILLNTV